MNRFRLQTLVFAALLSLILLPAVMPAQVNIVPPTSAKVLTGLSYGEWSTVWWQYAMSRPSTDANHPLMDKTGKGCAIDQDKKGPVFFLAGVGGDLASPVTRTECVAPAGKYLFFPLLNAFNIHFPNDGTDTADLLWEQLAGVFQGGSGLYVKVDGAMMDNLPPATYRTCAGAPASANLNCAPSFSVKIPANNLFTTGGPPPAFWRATGLHVPAGVYSPTVADGFYVMLAPLTPGVHRIEFGGNALWAGSPFVQNITYVLTVK